MPSKKLALIEQDPGKRMGNWEKLVHPVARRPYFVHKDTGQASWNTPAEVRFQFLISVWESPPCDRRWRLAGGLNQEIIALGWEVVEHSITLIACCAPDRVCLKSTEAHPLLFLFWAPFFFTYRVWVWMVGGSKAVSTNERVQLLACHRKSANIEPNC